MSNSTKRLFGTDGVRGEAGRFPLDQNTLRTVGASLAAHLKRDSSTQPLIVIGRDTRESGPWLEGALTEGAIQAGAQVRSAGVITTPGVAFLARSLPADAGVVISASHNPYQDNGFKIFAPSGRKLDDETERLIEADILNQHHRVSLREGHGDLETRGREDSPKQPQQLASALQARYLEFLEKEIGAGLSLAGLSIVIDAANGAASVLAPELFKRLGASVIAINDEPDGHNINRNCGSLHIEQLQQKVVSENADLGVAFDGDADRALFVDSQGQYVDGDATLWVLSNYMHARKQLRNGLVVATVMSNIGLEIALRSLGLQLVRTDVGDKYVLDELIRSDASLGGEQSGHIIFPLLSLAGDGMITTLCLLRAMIDSHRPLHQLVAGFARYPQVLVNVEVAEKRPFDEVKEIKRLVAETESQLGDRGRLLLRYSGTEPLARIMIEGDDHSSIEGLARNLAAAIDQTLGAR